MACLSLGQAESQFTACIVLYVPNLYVPEYTINNFNE